LGGENVAMSTIPSSPASVSGGSATGGGSPEGVEGLGNGGMSSSGTGGRVDGRALVSSSRMGCASLKLVRRGRVPLPVIVRGGMGGECVSKRRETLSLVRDLE
jgi:hypothetical protein